MFRNVVVFKPECKYFKAFFKNMIVLFDLARPGYGSNWSGKIYEEGDNTNIYLSCHQCECFCSWASFKLLSCSDFEYRFAFITTPTPPPPPQPLTAGNFNLKNFGPLNTLIIEK